MGLPLVVTNDPDLTQHLRQLSRALKTPMMRTTNPANVHRLWHAASVVVLGDDCARNLTSAAPREHVVLLVTDLDDASVWARGAALGATDVLWLPEHAPRLAAHLVANVYSQTRRARHEPDADDRRRSRTVRSARPARRR